MRAGLAAGLAATLLVLAGCGGSPKPVYDVAPAWTLPPATVAGGFCRQLQVDFGHIRDPAEDRTSGDLHANYAGFFAALPHLVPAAPASLRPAVAVYVATTTALFRVLLDASPGSHVRPPAHAADLRSPEVARAITAVDRYAAATCRPDPLG